MRVVLLRTQGDFVRIYGRRTLHQITSDTVFLTHGHPDHIEGNADTQEKSTFPKAHYVMWKDEWDFWTSEETESKLDEHVRKVLLGFARKNLPPIQS